MRTFSQLRKNCAYPITLDALGGPRPARDKAAGLGTEFHARIDAWVATGALDDYSDASKVVKGWLDRMVATGWTPPSGCRSEVACGLRVSDDDTDRGWLRPVEVIETSPHVYVAKDGNAIATAGRVDLMWKVLGVLYVADVKTGRTYLGPPAEIPQLTAGACALSDPDGDDMINVGVYYARLGVWDWSGLLTYRKVEHTTGRALGLPDAPIVGGHCLGCWNTEACEAYPGTKKGD